tara:strand:- start:285 stop:473 length:189 start_codon:yes stop_codon:yes gene_type:complete
MDLESDFIFDDMCEAVFPAIEWMLEDDDVKPADIPELLAEEDDINLEQAERLYKAYKVNNNE